MYVVEPHGTLMSIREPHLATTSLLQQFHILFLLFFEERLTVLCSTILAISLLPEQTSGKVNKVCIRACISTFLLYKHTFLFKRICYCFQKTPRPIRGDQNITIFTSFIQAHTQTCTQTTHKNCTENNKLSAHI